MMIQVVLPEKAVEKIDALVSDGRGNSRSDLGRMAILQFLEDKQVTE